MTKRIYAKVVADLMHPGHIEFFRHARNLGDHLTVSIVSDDRVIKNKGKQPILTTDERAALVAGCRWVDHVITDGPKEITLSYMDSHGYDIYAYGGVNEHELESKLNDCKQLPSERRIIVPYTHTISTSLIIKRVLRLNSSDL